MPLPVCKWDFQPLDTTKERSVKEIKLGPGMVKSVNKDISKLREDGTGNQRAIVGARHWMLTFPAMPIGPGLDGTQCLQFFQDRESDGQSFHIYLLQAFQAFIDPTGVSTVGRATVRLKPGTLSEKHHPTQRGSEAPLITITVGVEEDLLAT